MKKEKTASIKLKLPIREMQIMMIHAGAVGISVEQLLQSFVLDLTHSDRSGGSDEREKATAWYERAHMGRFRYVPENQDLLQYLLARDGLHDYYTAIGIQEMIDAYDEAKELQKTLAEETDEEERKSIQTDIEYDEKEIHDTMSEYAKYTGRKESELSVAAEIERMRTWKKKYDEYKSV